MMYTLGAHDKHMTLVESWGEKSEKKTTFEKSPTLYGDPSSKYGSMTCLIWEGGDAHHSGSRRLVLYDFSR
jgi:hypothetical protein